MASPVEKKKRFSSADQDKNQQQTSAASDSFVPTIGSKRKRRLRKIWVCNDVWMDILPFFRRRHLGLKLALISPRFDVLVDTHFDAKSEFKISRLIQIRKDTGPEPKQAVFVNYAESVQLPLSDHPLPNKIRIKDLCIKYIDHSVITLLRSNQQIWQKGIALNLSIWSGKNDVQPIWDIVAQQIWPIFAAHIRQLDIPNGDLDNLRHLISPTILTDLDQLNAINSGDLVPDMDGDDGPYATAEQALSKWLHTPTINGQPKRLRCRFTSGFDSEAKEWVNDFKETFSRATASASYKIELIHFNATQIKPFELVNERTNEKLTVEKGPFHSWWIMKRCPIVVGETAADQWKENLDEKNLVDVTFSLNGV